jgi:hypothetical protein
VAPGGSTRCDRTAWGMSGTPAAPPPGEALHDASLRAEPSISSTLSEGDFTQPGVNLSLMADRRERPSSPCVPVSRETRVEGRRPPHRSCDYRLPGRDPLWQAEATRSKGGQARK